MFSSNLVDSKCHPDFLKYDLLKSVSQILFWKYEYVLLF